MNQHQTIPSPVGGGLGWGRNTPMPDNAPLPTSPSRGKEYSYRAPSPEPRAGFTLVELALVIVILGLIVGGVVVGQDLIRASEVRSIVEDFRRYTSAISTFRDKYLQIPGDIDNATSFWGKDNTNCPTHSGTAATNGTCNGDADGLFDVAAAASGTGEEFQFWRHLALSGIIAGNFTGLSGSGGTNHTVIGTNVPATRMSGGGYSLTYHGTYSGSTNFFDGDYGNALQVGSQFGTARTGAALLKGGEAWDIDIKLDDGKLAYGIVRGDRPTSGNIPNCATTDVASTTQYNVTYNGAACRLQYILGF